MINFTPTNRPLEISDQIAKALHDIAYKKAKDLTSADRSDLLLASGFILGQACLIRANASDQMVASS